MRKRILIVDEALHHGYEIPDLMPAIAINPNTYALKDWINPDISPLPENEAIKFSATNVETINYLTKHTSPKLRSKTVDTVKNFTMWRRSERTRIKPLIKTTEGLVGAKGTIFKREGKYGKGLTLNLATEMIVRLDMNFPLAPQLKEVIHKATELKKLLESEKLSYAFPKRADKGGIYQEYIQILDYLSDGRSSTEIAQIMKGKKITGHTKYVSKKIVAYKKTFDAWGAEINSTSAIAVSTRKKITRALELRDFGYLALAFL